jgi:hypothetical protein
MPESVTLPDVEAAVVAHLKAAPTGATKVATEVPSTLPAKFLRVLSLGGPPRTDRVIDRPIVSVEAWADTALNAWDVMAKADAAMDALDRGASTTIRGCRALSRPYRNDDPTTGRPRYLARYQLTMRASTTTI